MNEQQIVADLPVSSVPAAFDRGHLYSPTLDVANRGITFRPGSEYEPMPEAPRNSKGFAWWMSNIATLEVSDYLGLRVGDEVTIQYAGAIGVATVIATHRFGAVVRYPTPQTAGRPTPEGYVRRRNQAGHWYR